MTPLFVKVFTADNSAKSLLADERMSVSAVCRQLAEKNHIVMDPKCSIVEHIPQLYLERFYEDNESLVENVLLWTNDSPNRLYFMEKEEKYDLCVSPERYLLGASSSERDTQLDDEAKATLVDEFFTAGGVPEVEGQLYLKSDDRKCWKKHFFVLRASGLYYCPKGKSKSSKDLVCLTTFEMNNIYYAVGWRKKFKAPNDFGFAIKHPQIQTKSSKYIKYLCADSEEELRLWTTGIRIAKYGRQLKDNYDNIMRDIVEADLDSLANRRSFSVCSMAKTTPSTSPTNSAVSASNGSGTDCGDSAVSTSNGSAVDCGDSTVSASNGYSVDCGDHHLTSITITANYNNRDQWPHNRMSRHDSIRSSSTSSSSGFMSERGSSASTPIMEQLAFEADFPVCTIKRKPSGMQPKIPLTNTTRGLVLQSDDALVEVDSSSSESEDIGAQPQFGTLKSGTLRRSATDECLKSRIYDSLREHRFKQNINNINANNSSVSTNNTSAAVPPLRATDDTLVDELPLPPPPQVLQTSMSTLSLNSLPPPPNELLDSPNDLHSNSTTPTAMSPMVSPKKSPQSPQVPPKPKLFRRVSESANDRNNFVNELKSRSNTLQRGLNSRSKLSDLMNNSAISAYATSPRMRCGPYVQAMNGESNYSSGVSIPDFISSNNVGSETPVNASPIHQRSPTHYQPFPQSSQSIPNQLHSPTTAGSPQLPQQKYQCYQQPPQQQPIYQACDQLQQQYQTRQSQPMPDSQQLYQNRTQCYQQLNQINSNLNTNINSFTENQLNQQYMSCNNNNNNNNSVVNTSQMCHQLQTQPYYPYSQQLSHQIYGTQQMPVLSMQQQQSQRYAQQHPQQQPEQCYQQIGPHFVGQPHQSVPKMQIYSNQQPIYQSSGSMAPNSPHMRNGQTYTKSKMIYSDPMSQPSERSPMKGPLPPPPEEFLREIQRVMDKKWKVAQTLSTDMSATPNQILGFRDPVYLPPNSSPNHQNNIYDVLPNRPAMKSVRISLQVNEIPAPPVAKHHKPNQSRHRLPPPPPKRSEKTHLSQRQV